MIDRPCTSEGVKYDNEKLDFTLLPWEAMESVVRVLGFGAKKYSRDNWQHVEPKLRYISAAYRHLIAYSEGEKSDKESGENHLAHAVCCLLFKLWSDIQEEK